MNILEFFEEYGVEVWTEGKNVSAGWCNINCPFCDDVSNHLGIRYNDFRVHCWKCGGHSIEDVISEVAECSYAEAKRIFRTLGAGRVDPPMIVEKTASSVLTTQTQMPRESSIHFPKLHIEYLRSRGFKPRQLIRKYKLRAVHTIGRYKFRVIIPIYMHHRLVSFTSRDVTGDQEPKYKHALPEECIFTAKKTIYNYDTLLPGADAFLVEGPVDVWKLGDGAVSLLGVKHTMEQVRLLMKKEIATLFIFFDNDADGRKTARYFARLMAPLVKKVEVVLLEEKGDPGELKFSEVSYLKQQIGFSYAN